VCVVCLLCCGPVVEAARMLHRSRNREGRGERTEQSSNAAWQSHVGSIQRVVNSPPCQFDKTRGHTARFEQRQRSRASCTVKAAVRRLKRRDARRVCALDVQNRSSTSQVLQT
jgi:hypothetical protein